MDIPGEEGGKGNALANGVGNADDDSDAIGDGGGGGEIDRLRLEWLLLSILKLI
jgi:hypothetical protein